MNAHLENKFGEKNIVLSFSNYQVSFNNSLISSTNLDADAIMAESIRFLQNQAGVAFVIDNDDIQNSPIPEVLKDRLVNGYHKERSGIIQILLKPGWYSAYSETGIEHGSWSTHDSHIPLLWMGWGINKGKTNREAKITDIAATLAALLGIQMPNGCIGQPISEGLKTE